tara:strand:+ start:158 stop:1123 length:966 start_codon:yes stop_codon:yes gene_type:complete
METEDRQKFLEGRKGIGSSDVPKILGWSQWGGPAEVYDSITSVLDGNVVADSPSFAANRGLILEPIAAKRWCSENNREVRRQPQRSHPVYPYMIANVDRQIISKDGMGTSILEIKCPMLSTFIKIRDFGETRTYNAQLQHQLAIYGYPVGYLGIYHPDYAEMINIEVPRDDSFIDNVLHPTLNSFWEQHILKRTRPEPEDIEAAEKIPELTGGLIARDGTPEFAALVEKWLSTDELSRNLKEVHAFNTGNIKAYMEERDMVGVEGAGVKIHYRPQKPRLTWDGPLLADKLHDMDLNPNDFKKKTKASRPFKVYRTRQETIS